MEANSIKAGDRITFSYNRGPVITRPVVNFMGTLAVFLPGDMSDGPTPLVWHRGNTAVLSDYFMILSHARSVEA